MGCGQSKVVPEQISPLPPCKTSVKDHAQQNIQPKEEEPIKNEEPKEITSNINNEKQPILIKDNDIEAFGLILCGTGETGKTTYARQLKLKYVGIEDDERKSLIPTIKGNLVESMQLLLIWLERNSMEISPDLEQAAQDILALNPFACDFTPQLAESLQQLWQDPSIQTAYRHKDETIIPDNVGYFFDKIDDLQDEDYVPSDDDVLRVRVRSIGIDSITFDLDGAIIRIYDVGGQKNERSKWEKIMSEVGGCIYFVSLAEFDKPMFEDIQMVRINDSLEVFSQVVKKEEFREAPIFLICNKFDEFTEKIRETDCFTKVFPEYIGDPHDPDKCAQYIVDKFLERAKPLTESRPIIVYRQVSLDSQQVIDNTLQMFKYISQNYYE